MLTIPIVHSNSISKESLDLTAFAQSLSQAPFDSGEKRFRTVV